jgi:hypothetical protein
MCLVRLHVGRPKRIPSCTRVLSILGDMHSVFMQTFTPKRRIPWYARALSEHQGLDVSQFASLIGSKPLPHGRKHHRRWLLWNTLCRVDFGGHPQHLTDIRPTSDETHGQRNHIAAPESHQATARPVPLTPTRTRPNNPRARAYN